MTRSIVEVLRAEIALRGDPAKAEPMRAYMKSALPYRGVMTTPLRAIYRAVFPRYLMASFGEWRGAVLRLWREARYREERYAAISLAGYERYAGFRTTKSLPMFEEMIVTGAWWDYVDGIASGQLGEMLRRYPVTMRRRMIRWSRCDDMWKRRASILCQLRFRDATDLDLLHACIEPNLSDKEFFIRKAIGWALRQYAWTDPREVALYVERLGDRLSPLSRREALKNAGPIGPREGGGNRPRSGERGSIG